MQNQSMEMTYKIPSRYPVQCKGHRGAHGRRCRNKIESMSVDYYGYCFECYLIKNCNEDVFDPYYEPHEDPKSILYDGLDSDDPVAFGVEIVPLDESMEDCIV